MHTNNEAAATPEDSLAKPLDPSDPPPNGRFCDLVIEGGVINGVAYPGFLVEVARRFHLHSVGGASVGAIAAALAVACEYGRRFGSVDGYNEGLRKLPENLAEIVDGKKNGKTRIRSLFQPTPELKPLFEFALDVIEESIVDTKNNECLLACMLRYALVFYRHFLSPWVFIILGFTLCVAIPNAFYLNPVHANHPVNVDAFRWLFFLLAFLWALGFFIVHPCLLFYMQVNILSKAQGFGMCSGMPNPDEKDSPETLTQWVYKGIQDAAGLPYAKPLTFGDLWLAPGAPRDASGKKADRSIDLRTVTSCLNHGRIYELPAQDPTARLFFRLSEFSHYFPKEVIDYLRQVSKRVDVVNDPLVSRYKARIAFLQDPTQHSYTPLDASDLIKRINAKQKEMEKLLCSEELKGTHNYPDIRELPNADLPIVVAARLSLSVPILFQAIPMLAFDLEVNAEAMELRRLWFSDGGIGNNFPIQLFDKALPQRPTFGVKVLEISAKRLGGAGERETYVPYFHDRNKNDIFIVDPEHKTDFNQDKLAAASWSTFATFLMGIFQTAKDGGDHAFMRMPSVRNRVLRLYTDHATGNALNLNIRPDKIEDVARIGVKGGKNLVTAYLGERVSTHCETASLWVEHRWVRFNLLVNTLRKHLSGFEMAAYNNTFQPSIFEQIEAAKLTPPLLTRDGIEYSLSDLQAKQLEEITNAIIKLEQKLTAMNLPLPYVPEPESSLQIKPKI